MKYSPHSITPGLLQLRNYTPARVALARAGDSLTTCDVLNLHEAHARAKDALYETLNEPCLQQQFKSLLWVSSQVTSRQEYLLRPDLGRLLHPQDKESLALQAGKFDCVLVMADGLSAGAIHTHAAPLIRELLPLCQASGWEMAPLIMVRQGRVAVGDEIAFQLQAKMVVVLIGERPGLSVPCSLGAYITYAPHPGTKDDQRYCISNIHAAGTTYAAAASLAHQLLSHSFQHRLSGVSNPLLPGAAENS